MKGKHICQMLKEIRQSIAQANEIDYTPAECTHKGDCAGTCPACENEMRYIERQLLRRQAIGKAAVIAGLTLGATSISPAIAQNQVQPTSTATTSVEPKLLDCAPNDNDAIIVRGYILDEQLREPAIGATILLLDKSGKTTTKYGIVSNVDGRFAIRVTKGSKVQVSNIGYETEILTFNEPDDNMLILLKDDKNALMGDVIYIPPKMHDVDADIYENRY